MPTNTAHRLVVTLPSDREILLTRVFDAPRKLVFDACTKPEHLREWFGPRGFTLPVCKVDLRPGGSFHYILRGPDGSEMAMRGEIREVEAPERIVQTESYDIPGMGWTPASENTLTLAEYDGKTTLTTRVVHVSKEARDGHVGSGMERGAGETFDRLAELLETMS
jgi:uncharacterized protein YndB with AHSA1/START domain